MPTYPHVDRYHRELAELIEFGGVDNEENIRPAFQNCLAAYCVDHSERLVFLPELRTDRSNKPDGTVRDSLRMTRGLWEAKDTHDDLDREIQNKLAQGYPSYNILFEDSRTAVLFQDRQEKLRVDMTDPATLDALIRQFLDYELPEIQEFREAREQFRDDLPAVLENLRDTIVAAEASNSRYQEAAKIFLELCHQSISPAVSNDNVREMLIQHILTKDIFLRVFAEDQFHRENNVARQLDALEGTFFTGNVRRDAVDRLRAYYGAIGRAADDIAEYGEKQQFLKGIYEDFYQAYNPGAADRLGVVYTPNEVVDFIIRGADWLLQKHFGKTLGDKNVNILDPATGTGTFITNLMSHLPADRLEYKYRHEIHANEVEILPYYIANLNVEYTYKELTGNYLEFPNLCFVDTLDNMDWRGASGAAVQRQTALNLGGVSEENWIRVQEQNEKPISVIIGNPPYNDSATLWGDGGANRRYPQIDRRIRDTYVEHGTAQRTHQYDMYKRFIRWASDRLEDDGVIGFVSNSAFLHARQDDGFRKVISEEFNELWAVDLKGNARTSGERRRQEGGNVFSDKIRVGVAVYFLVRRQRKTDSRCFTTQWGTTLEPSTRSTTSMARHLVTLNSCRSRLTQSSTGSPNPAVVSSSWYLLPTEKPSSPRSRRRSARCSACSRTLSSPTGTTGFTISVLPVCGTKHFSSQIPTTVSLTTATNPTTGSSNGAARCGTGLSVGGALSTTMGTVWSRYIDHLSSNGIWPILR